MKSSAYQFIFVVIHVVTSSHCICLISASCAMPDPIPYTIITLPSQTLDTGSYITWQCSDGYMMDGLTNTVVWVCLEDGSWLGDLGHTPICKDVECPSPPIAAYSELDPPLAEALVVNQTISYTCSSSEYTLLESSFNRCLHDGTWDNDPPVCQRKCDPANTRRYTNLTCFRTSNTQRTWEESFDFCYDDNGELILATVKDVEMQKFIRENLNRDVWIGAMEGQDWKWRESDTYIDRFFWEKAYPDQSPGDCIEISYQSNSGEFAWSPRSSGDEIGVLCQYDRTCQSCGLDKSDHVLEYMGTCFQFLNVSKNCDDGAEECNGRGGFLGEILDESTNALLLYRAQYLRDIGVYTAWWIGGYDEDVIGRSWYWSDKTRVIYEAWRGNQPNNNDHHCVRMKKSNYRWDDSSCEDNKGTLCQVGITACGDPGEPLHGYRLPDDRTTYSVGATLHFTCQEGYTLSGESVLSCMNSGAWNHQRPSCEAVECEASPPEVALASAMIQGSVYQDIALYTCQEGFIPDNEPISLCQHTGNWSTPNFTCTELSPCYSNPCVNGGTCTMNGSSFTCTCPLSYTVPTCDEAPSPCYSNPCDNGGTCTVNESSFTCTCPSGYTGPTCDDDFSLCNSNPCMNGGTCLDVYESPFSCTCTPGFTGSTCSEEIMRTTPLTFTTQASPQSTDSQTEIQKGESSPTGAIAAGSSVAILFILLVIVVTLILFRRRRAAKPVLPDDENEMDNYATVANCYEDSKPPDSTPGEPYYLTLEPDSDQNGGVGTSVAEQPSPHLWKGVTQDDTPSVIKGSNGWNETDTGGGFVDNVLYGTSDEQSPSPGNPKSGASEIDDDGYEDEEIMVDNELYNAPSRTTPRDQKLETVDDKGNGDAHENPDENVYTEFTDDEILINNELYGAPSPITPRAHKLDAMVDEGKDPVYENPDGNVYETFVEDAMVDNELYGASTPPTSRADNTNDPVVGEGDGEMYQNTEFHSVPTNLIANELYKSVDEI